ncbi:serine carboxypeptidase-like 40 isoform X1 [Alnus glutinosa]|uniref:serine carboxypeptidase-like 40 isoform X1 n=1 Tax=Alnus glutinosa TaxID=3517 RepID=UPI002D7803BD|nr:serine carboxypeptidase-like 40 isoform X1 [Alnus glutinosa]
MESKPFCWVLLAFFILSCFVGQTHGRMKEQGLHHLYKAISKPNFGLNTSLFQAADLVVDQTNVLPQQGLKERDWIKAWPGQPPVKFSQYGGYVTVNKIAGRALYYYLAEAQQYKDTLPLLLWLNGGPGCSSLAYGAMQELGPFRVLSDGKTLFKNNFSWNYAANVLFLESPAGVGYSYSNTTSDYDKMGDRITAADNYLFLVNWLERFPEYKNRPFYISGESYAGHYVPQLAHTILHHNKKANRTIINLKGIIIGNAIINDETDERGMYDYFATHALVPDRLVSQIQKYCDFSPKAGNQSSECYAATNALNIGNINIYNIYAPLCFSTNVTARPKKASILNFDPCSNYYVYAYLNRPDVQAAIHANVTKLTHDWEPCSDIIRNWLDSPSTIIPLLQEFMANGLRVWVFSGDTDGRVPVTSTKYSLDKLKLPVKTDWHPWFLMGEVGGYTEVYEGDLTFATVRDAGHQVPSFQPARGLSLIKHFLDGTPLPNTKRS